MKKFIFLASVALAAIASCCKTEQKDYTQFVDPLIGSGGHGHVFVGANVPYGMVQVGPQQIRDSWDWCSGYQYSDTLVIGFSHTHLSGTGIGDLGDILLMPYDPAKTIYSSEYMPRKKTEAVHVYAHLDHAKEVVTPGYYSLEMPDYGVNVRLTATARTGLHEYTFTADTSAILVDLCSGIGWDGVTDWELTVKDETHIEGYRRSSGWAEDHTYWFAAEFSEPVIGQTTEIITDKESATALLFDTSVNKKIFVKVGISPVSAENAWENLRAEQPEWDFEGVRAAAKASWNEKLGLIDIEPMDEKQCKIFYTSLYHTMISPSVFSDVNGEYRGADGNVYSDEHEQYTIFSLWDTYRTASPLMTIIDGEKAASVASTFMNIYNQQGKLPVWHLAGNETNCMIGNPGVIVMADLILKGFVKDVPAALEAMKASSMLDERGQELLKVYGYIPFDKSAELETVSKAMEFAIADACLAKVAREYGDTEAAGYFGERSQSWKKHYDPSVGFVRGRASDGSWRTPFDEFKALHMQSDFTEGNAWQYTWLVPQDPQGLIEILGGQDAFIAKLDQFFVAEGDLGPNANDVTGLVGQYAHGNEPSHHIAYFYNYVGQPYKCAEKVRHIMDELYFDNHEGVCGNEDAGQMSAWYVLSSLGLYQVDPAKGEFQFGSPAMKKAVVNVGGGRTFTVVAENNSPENIYILSATLNGKALDRTYVTYEEIMAGGVLEFVMGPQPQA
jgi:predicted alpha-1,2-mannosidase